jgi:tRNA (guanosine-2'-O-)-methyltransferase
VDGGLVQFMIAWDESNADVDLDVTDPRGRVVELGRASDSGLLRDRDCPGKDQECRGINIENVTLVAPDKLLRGTYIVRVRLERWNQVDMPVRVNLAARLGAKAFFVQLKLEREKQERRFELVL